MVNNDTQKLYDEKVKKLISLGITITSPINEINNKLNTIVYHNKHLSLGSKNVYYKAILNHLKNTTGNEKLINDYSKLITKITKDVYITPSSKNKDKGGPKWKDILKAKVKIMDDNNIPSSHKLLVNFYTLQEPRRIEDLFYMKIYANKPTPSKIDTETNYYIYGVTRPYFSYYHHKNDTSKDGKLIIQKITTPKELKVILNEYIKTNKLKDGDKLISWETTTAISKYLARAFSSHSEFKNISVNALRHAYITEFLKDDKLSLKKKKLTASKMGHSYETQASYQQHL